jgi:hypothetical protein
MLMIANLYDLYPNQLQNGNHLLLPPLSKCAHVHFHTLLLDSTIPISGTIDKGPETCLRGGKWREFVIGHDETLGSL